MPTWVFLLRVYVSFIYLFLHLYVSSVYIRLSCLFLLLYFFLLCVYPFSLSLLVCKTLCMFGLSSVYLFSICVPLCDIPSVCKSHHVYISPYMSLHICILLCVSLNIFIPSVCTSSPCACVSACLFFYL